MTTRLHQITLRLYGSDGGWIAVSCNCQRFKVPIAVRVQWTTVEALDAYCDYHQRAGIILS